MKINSYIRFEMTPLTPLDTVVKVREQFSEWTYTHIPVLENDYLLGNISEDDTYSFDEEKSIVDYKYALDTFFVRKGTNWLEVLEAFARNNANIMPVIDKNNNYVGYYELMDIITFFNETPFLNEPGGILIVEKGHKDYSFSELSQIVESNNGKLLGAFISDSRDDIVQLTLKIGNVGLNAVIQSFRRYNYNVVSGNEDDLYIEDLKERSDYLKRFLDI
ncbi:CBS domain-containing protein [Leptobacterium flavescens]|uniref:CBS domain-containing protein n=2 Tax=Leptobacterium flavescens TaxID=472055 RepID=A0A6P0UH00_9FLAO|nr:CBS domain-containing protein [Leptobacterium flavescens]